MGRLDLLWVPEEDPSALRTLLGQVVEDAHALGLQHLSCRMKLERVKTIQVLEEFGFKYVDSLHTLTRRGPLAHSSALPIREPIPSDRVEVSRMARTAFARNRFASDPHLPAGKDEEVYEQWAANCLSGARGDYNAILEFDGQVAGFITCLLQKVTPSETPSIGVIDLVSVAPEFHGRGGGRQLVQAALQWLEPRSILQTVGTRCDNYAALSLYMKAGFRLSSSHLGMHLWL